MFYPFAGEPKSYVEYAMKEFELHTGFRFVEWNESTQAIYGLSHNNRLRYITTGL